jgi:hypothetical protein
MTEYEMKLRDALLDCAMLLQTIHTRETTGRGPSYHTYSGQVASTIQKTINLLNRE